MGKAKTYARASHLRNEDEQRSQMGEISCLVEDNGQRIVPDMLHSVRSREQAIPSIRKRFMLSDYARAGERREGVGLTQSRGSVWCFGVVKEWYGDRPDEGVSEVIVVVRVCCRESGQVSFNGLAAGASLPRIPL